MLLFRPYWQRFIGKRAAVRVVEAARFDILVAELVPLLHLAYQWQAKTDEALTITGADRNPAYPEGGVHQAGYGWDLRVWDIKEPAKLASYLLIELKRIDANYKVLYGGPGHLDHIHVSWEGSSRF